MQYVLFSHSTEKYSKAHEYLAQRIVITRSLRRRDLQLLH
jgi:hypothetical protein